MDSRFFLVVLALFVSGASAESFKIFLERTEKNSEFK